MADIPAYPKRSRVEMTVESLSALILHGPHEPGHLLPPEAELCRRIGVSRTTIREAIRILQSRGLVVAEHGIGVRVIDGTAKAAADSIERMLSWTGAGPKDVFEVRLMLECQGASLAATRATPEEIDAIAAAIDAMSNQPHTQHEMVELDFDFHLRIAEASHNLVLLTLLQSIRGLLFDTISAAHAMDSRDEVRIRYHSEILASIRARDANASFRAMKSHLDETIELVTLAEASIQRNKGGEPDVDSQPVS